LSLSITGGRVFHVQTECYGQEELADKLAPYCGDDSLALPGARGLAVGAVTRFSVSLASGDEVLAGRGHVLSMKGGTGDGSGSTVRVKILELQDDCRLFWVSLLQRRRPTSRLPGPPAPPAAAGAAPGRPPPSFTLLDPGENAFTAMVRETSFGEPGNPGAARDPVLDARTVKRPSQSGQPTSETMPLPTAPQLAVPARLAGGPTRTTGKTPAYTGKTPGYTGKVMVARKSPWPPWALALGASLARVRERLWQTVPEDARPAVARFGPWLTFWAVGLLCGLWWAPSGSVPVVQGEAVSAVASVAKPAPMLAVSAPHVRPLYDHCSVKLTTEPAGAMVSWGELALGETPLDNMAVPCGRALVSLRLAGFTPIVITMTATLDGPVVFSQALKRPDAQLKVFTKPSGATVFVNGSLSGTSPADLLIPENETFELRLEKSGYPPITKQLRLDGPQKSMNFKFALAASGAAKAKRDRRR